MENESLRPGDDLGDILKLVGCKIFTRESLKLKWTHGSRPTALRLKKLSKECKFLVTDSF